MKSKQEISSGPNHQHGFTLVEMMVVIGIIAVTLAIAIPTYHLTIKPTARLNGAARRIYSDIQLARMRAVSEGVRYGLAFYGSPDYYIVFKDNNTANSQYDNNDGGLGNDEKIIKTVTLADDYPNVVFDTASGDTGDGVDLFGANNSTSMQPSGLPTKQGTIYLINEKGEGREIVINQMGGVRIEKY